MKRVKTSRRKEVVNSDFANVDDVMGSTKS